MTAEEGPRWADGTPPAEKVLYQAVRDALPADVEVLPQVVMTVDARGRPTEAEADLVVIDPRHGVLVVEVKGGTLSWDPTQRVWRRRERSSQAIRDPVLQVKKARSTLRTLLKQARVPIDDLPLRWVVAVPDCVLEPPGPGVIPDDLLWDASALTAIVDAVRRAQGPLGGDEAALGPDRAGLISRILRGREVAGTPSSMADVTDHEQRVRALTESHRNVMHQFLHERRVLVRGAAGTGKTMLALEVAARYAADGQRVLLTCWNRLLAAHLRERLAQRLRDCQSPLADHVTAEPQGRVVVTDLVGLAGRAAPPDGVDQRAWYQEHLPSGLDAGATNGVFDVVVLDEAQDASELWLLLLAHLTADAGRWVAFADRRQDLFSEQAELSGMVELEHQLRENFRNTRQIAEFCYHFGDVEMDCLSGEGPPVELQRVAADRVVGRVPEVARKLIRDEGFAPHQVAAIWLYHNPLQGDPDALITQDREGEMVTTNSAAFKGMEREVVVLGVDVRGDRTKEQHLRALYVAASRARSKLVVLADPAQLRDAELHLLASQFPATDSA